MGEKVTDARCLPSATTTLLTPRWILDALGEFDLDPCCPPEMPWRTARDMIQQPSDGLAVNWYGRVWLNPPYGRGMGAWLKKLAQHGSGVALVFARTETKWFQDWVLGAADGILFLDKTVRFCRPDGTPGGSPPVGSILAFYNDNHQINYDYWASLVEKLSGRWVDL